MNNLFNNGEIGSILIKLDQGESTKSFPTEELINRRHYQSLREQIKVHLESTVLLSDLSKHSRFPFGSGWTQFVDGSRGAGKSTFLSSVRKALTEDLEIKDKMMFFDIIDPSRIEHSQMPLLVILQTIRKKVDLVIGDRRKLGENSFYEDWRRAFSRVAGGLSLFAKDFHPLDDLDPELFLDWGLERTSDSIRLRDGLHQLFEIACRILNVRALILGFDDADTDSTLAIPLLESIRKYLDTPHVMVLVTGDLELYSLLMRQRFGKTVVGRSDAAVDLQRSSKQGDRSAQYLRMIDHLEEQYLLKIFPIRRRLQLQSLWNVGTREECRVTHKDWGEASFLVKDVVDALIKHGLRVKTQSDVDQYTEFLLKQPLRTILQLIERCAPYLVGEKSKRLDSLSWSPELTQALSRSLHALALTSLYKLSIDTDAIAERELPALIQAVFDLSLQDGDIDTAPYLRPMSADLNIKACFAALASEVPNFCAQNPGMAIKYLLRGPGSVSLYSFAQENLKSGGSFRSIDPVHTFTSYMGVGRKEDGLDWARHATAVVAQPYSGNYKGRVVAPGVVGLRRRSRVGEVTAGAAIKQIASKKDNGMLPVFALGMIHVVSETNSRTYASIYTIIGLIEKLLSHQYRGGGEVRTVFERVYPAVSVSAPSWSLKGGSTLEVEDSDGDNEIGALQADRDALWLKIDNWLKNMEDVSKNTLPSAILLGKIWTRIYFSLQNVAGDMKVPRFGFASLMEVFALCVINAFLVEEAEHHMHSTSKGQSGSIRVDRSNPRTSAERFVQKLKVGESSWLSRSDFPLTAVMATCPLLLGLLDRRKGYAAVLLNLFKKGYTEDKINELLCPGENFDILETVSIAGGKGDDDAEMAENLKKKKTVEKTATGVELKGSEW
ncbi:MULTISPECIES: hypothetical protein [Delftia]|uniref:hypothetical protein n=1 Tax=Delftia TaxID=80865 RepID=UPI0012E174E5|nr:hypothetical protein [Delftia lacustris]